MEVRRDLYPLRWVTHFHNNVHRCRSDVHGRGDSQSNQDDAQNYISWNQTQTIEQITDIKATG